MLIGFSWASKGIPDTKLSEVWLVRCDSQGRKQSEKAFSGSMPDACAVGGDDFALVCYKAGDPDTGVWLEKMHGDLQSKWSKKVCSVEPPAVPFHIVSADGGFVLAGTKGLRFWSAGLNEKGNELWHFQDTRDETHALLCLDMTSSEEGVFVLTSMESQRQDKDVYKLGLLKLSPKF